jgi:hypothetical protein
MSNCFYEGNPPPKITAQFGSPDWCKQVKEYGEWLDCMGKTKDDSMYEDEFEYQFVEKRGNDARFGN